MYFSGSRAYGFVQFIIIVCDLKIGLLLYHLITYLDI